MNDRQRIQAAFRDLDALGYFTAEDWACCQGCGWSAVPQSHQGRAVIFHEQDAEHFGPDDNLDGQMHLAWSGDRYEIGRVLFRHFGERLKLPHDETKRFALAPSRTLTCVTTMEETP